MRSPAAAAHLRQHRRCAARSAARPGPWEAHAPAPALARRAHVDEGRHSGAVVPAAAGHGKLHEVLGEVTQGLASARGHLSAQRQLEPHDILSRVDQIAHVLARDHIPDSVGCANQYSLPRRRAVGYLLAPHLGNDGNHPLLHLHFHVEVAQCPGRLQALHAPVVDEAAELGDALVLIGGAGLVVLGHPHQARHLGRTRGRHLPIRGRVGHVKGDERGATIT
mmetsp:Transcript_77184/g.218754  ORF Transcript_77184/g.218754 Transcript_77184/m.218754 type:complete len:222 (+) Transcript_77184:8-673(+)